MNEDVSRSIERMNTLTSSLQSTRSTGDEIFRNLVEPNLASEQYEKIARMVKQFEMDLDDEHEVGMRLVTFGEAIKIHVDDLGFSNPCLMRYYGFLEDGSKVQLIQHVSQISFLLVALQKTGEKPRRIGYKLKKDLEEE